MSKRKLKFLFIQPDFSRVYVDFFPVYEPLHGLLLGATIEDIADTVIFDRRFDTDNNLISILNDFKPDLIGITSHTAGEIYNIKRLLAIAKSQRPNALTIVGGQHATLLPEDLFGNSTDIVCIGPGEETFREVALATLNGSNLSDISGLAIRNGKEYELTPPRIVSSGKMSWPAFNHSLISEKYKRRYGFVFERRSNIYTITTTGCPYRCSFCSLWAAARGVFRYRAPEEVVRDIISQPQTYVHLTDDNTFQNEEHALEIYRLLKKSGVNKKILAYARTDTIADKPDLIAKWAEIGLGALVVGMEAVSDNNLDVINKKTSMDTNVQAQEILDKLNIENWAHFVIMPEFKKEDFDEVWDFVEHHNLTYPIFASFTPVAGTPLFFEAKKNNKLTIFDYGYYNLQYQVMKTTLPKEDWYKYYWDLYIKSSSPKTLLRRRKSPSFHFRPAIGRAMVMGKGAAKRAQEHIKEQIITEKTVRYEDIEHTLLPSLQRNYKADKYYNASSLTVLKKTHHGSES